MGAMKKKYVKIYITEQVYRDFKECIKPMKVGPALDVFMDMTVRTSGSFFQQRIENIGEDILESHKT
jgi:hypothetical protein